jgi:hypothetical protein
MYRAPTWLKDFVRLTMPHLYFASPMSCVASADPYCVIHLADGHGKAKTWKEIHRTEVIQHTLNPQFKCFVKTVADFCDRDYDRRIRVKMYDWDVSSHAIVACWTWMASVDASCTVLAVRPWFGHRCRSTPHRLYLFLLLVVVPICLLSPPVQNVGEHDYIGSFDMTVRSMLNPKSRFRIINEEKLIASQKPGGEKYKHSGSVTFKVAQHFTMLTDVDREADMSLVKHRREYTESQINPTKRKSFLAFMAGGQALVKAQALVRMATGLALHKTAEQLTEETHKARAAQQQQVIAQEGLQRMATNMQMFKKAQQIDETISIVIRGESLAKMDIMGLSDPFLEFFRLASGSSTEWEKMVTSEVMKNTLNPKWPPLLIKSKDLITNANDATSPDANKVLVKAYDWNSDGSVDYMGSFMTDYPAIRKCKDTRFDLMWTDPGAPHKTAKKRGVIIFESCKAVQVKTDRKEISQSNSLLKSAEHSKKEKQKKSDKLKRVKTGLDM